MKIAVPYDENGQVVLHLKEAGQYKIYDCLDDEILSEEIFSLAQDGSADVLGDSLAEALTSRGAYVLICGLLPISTLMKLQEARIQVLGGAAGNAGDRVQDFLNGMLHFDRGGGCASCSGSCSLQGGCSCGSAGNPADAEEPECDGNISACGHWCH